MLELASGLSAAAAVGATLLLPMAGRRDWPGRRWRLVVFALVPLIAILSTAVAGDTRTGVVVGLVVSGVAMVLPRHWFLVGAAFFSSLSVAFVFYGVYLVRVTFLLGAGVSGVVLGPILLALEIGAMALIAASAFEMVDALCAAPDPGAAPEEPAIWPIVCLQVPTYNEPPDSRHRDDRVAGRARLPGAPGPGHRQQHRPTRRCGGPLEAECERLRATGHRVSFVHLPTWPGYKAGALNWGMTQPRRRRRGPRGHRRGLRRGSGLAAGRRCRTLVTPRSPSSRRRRTIGSGRTAPVLPRLPRRVCATSSGSAWSAGPAGTRSSSRAPWAWCARSVLDEPSAAGTSGSSPRTRRSACGSWRAATGRLRPAALRARDHAAYV